jgi:hypothetical protein
MPLKELFDRVPLGASLPADLRCSNIVKEARTDRAWGAAGFNQWEHYTGTLEWVVFLTDHGKVVAKRYQVRGEEGQMAVDHYQRIDRSEWEIAGPANDPAALVQLRRACDELEFAYLGLPDSRDARIQYLLMSGRFKPDPEDADVGPDELFALAEASMARDDGRM